MFQGRLRSFRWHVMEGWEQKIDLLDGDLSIINCVCSAKEIMKATLTYFLVASSLDEYWQNLLEQCGVFRRPMGLDQEFEWMIQRSSHGSVSNSLIKLVFSAAIYHTWGKRNARIFQAKRADKDDVLCNIRRDTRAFLSAWKFF